MCPDANDAVDAIIHSVKKSHLNFYIQESPFSLLINLRKTFIKNKNGDPLMPPPSDTSDDDINEQKIKAEKLEQENFRISESMGQLEAELKDTRDALHSLSNKLEIAKAENMEELSKVHKSKKEVEKLKTENKSLKQSNNELRVKMETFKNDTDTLNKSLKTKDKEIDKLVSKNNNLEEQLAVKKAENRNLADENKNIVDEKIKLEASVLEKPRIEHDVKSTSPDTELKLEAETKTQTADEVSSKFLLEPLTTSPVSTPSSAITASPPTRFRNLCKHTPQCIVREPRPPPSPSITFLYNERSKYHQHMMLWDKKEFAGHPRCFSVENENYGCDDCTWLKWWYKWHGETHGFPDIPEWTYKKYQ